MGEYLKQKLNVLQEKHAIIGDVRGRGLMIGAELVNHGKEPAVQETDMLLEYMKDKGVLIGKTGNSRNVLAFQPPLIIDKDNVDELTGVLDDAIDYVENHKK